MPRPSAVWRTTYASIVRVVRAETAPSPGDSFNQMRVMGSTRIDVLRKAPLRLTSCRHTVCECPLRQSSRAIASTTSRIPHRRSMTHPLWPLDMDQCGSISRRSIAGVQHMGVKQVPAIADIGLDPDTGGRRLSYVPRDGMGPGAGSWRALDRKSTRLNS